MYANVRMLQRAVVCLGMLAPRKFMQKRKKVEVFKDAEDEIEQKKWRKVMNEIEEADSAVLVLKSRRAKHQSLPKDLLSNCHHDFALALGYVTVVTIDMGFLVEAQLEEELSEKLFGAIRICQMEMNSATFVDNSPPSRKALLCEDGDE
ncbi:unnamed protein product [Fraxinus pennsylvanica]|uniref:Protein ENHANCED DISEASE RESISTANCE 2 C-terminal domain-containing protein n=1 Tax=Fraxinus pennsylvanica TaxID=56036 RepID=A0AAD2A0K3_9LAMI|nr:unnamed protein product [Fraxinus pennsylvanica]